jgi:class 3 adenylate cyclase
VTTAAAVDRPAIEPPRRSTLVAIAWIVAALLPLVGFASLLTRERLDPGWTNHRVHFVLFLGVASADFLLASVAGVAARRRRDARVQLIALAFLVTGGFLGLHAIGTPMVLFTDEHAGFHVAIPVGLLLASLFAVTSAFVDLRPELGDWVIRRQVVLWRAVVVAMAVWFAYTVADLPPLDRPGSEGATGSLLALLAAGGTVVYGVAAARYYVVFRHALGLLPASVIACFVLLAEAMIGVAITGERAWHASWWEWHGLVVLAFLVVGYAARREWHQERFRELYLPGTRERSEDLSVLFSDLAGFTNFSERTPPTEMAAMLKAYYEVAAPLIPRFGGAIEHFTGDGIMATFSAHHGRVDHAERAARAALALQAEMARVLEAHPDWPRLRVGVNTGQAIVRELGGPGHVTYSAVGDSVNVAARLEAQAPVGGVLIGEETYRRLPDGTVAEPMPGLRVKGKDAAIDAFVLRAVP